MQTVLLAKLGYCGQHRRICEGAAIFVRLSPGSVDWPWSWRLEHSTGYLGVGEFCIQEYESLKCCELPRVLDVGAGAGRVALRLRFLSV